MTEKKRQIQMQKEGETKIMNNGMKCTIKKYNNYHNMTVQFEDGTVRKKIIYQNFARGEVKNPNLQKEKKVKKKEKNRVGETKIMNNGMSATIYSYTNPYDINIIFEDGYIIEHMTYARFTSGCVRNPQAGKRHIGETMIMNNGMSATIIDWENSTNLTIQFEDGTIKRYIEYYQFLIGNISNKVKKRPTEIIGETRIMNNGLEAKVVEYKNYNNIIVQFEDGRRRETNYGQFKRGAISYKGYEHHKPVDAVKKRKVSDWNKTRNENARERHLGETKIMKNGMKATIIGYENSFSITVQLEDGTVYENIPYSKFVQRNLNKKNKCVI